MSDDSSAVSPVCDPILSRFEYVLFELVKLTSIIEPHHTDEIEELATNKNASERYHFTKKLVEDWFAAPGNLLVEYTNEAVSICQRIGLVGGDSELLRLFSKAVRERAHILFDENALNETPEELDKFQKTFGPFDLPTHESSTNHALLAVRWWEVVGLILKLREYSLSLLEWVASLDESTEDDLDLDLPQGQISSTATTGPNAAERVRIMSVAGALSGQVASSVSSSAGMAAGMSRPAWNVKEQPIVDHADDRLPCELICLSEMRSLTKNRVGKQTIRNNRNTCPKAVSVARGRRAALYRYHELREWFIKLWPHTEGTIPRGYEEAKNIISTQVSKK